MATRLAFYQDPDGTEITRDQAESLIRPLDAVAITSGTTIANVIRFWTEDPRRPWTPTHWEQVMAGPPEPVDLTAEPVGLVPRRLDRLWVPGCRGEIWRNITARGWQDQAPELLARWAARFHKGYDLIGAVRSADRAEVVLGSRVIKSHPASIWCSQSVFLFCRTLGEGFDPAPGYDAERDGVDTGELYDMIRALGDLWFRVLRWGPAVV
jgi:hypothetical protein